MHSLKLPVLRHALVVMALAAALPAGADVVVVPGHANLNLAGRDDGYACCEGDVAPGQSPTLVSGLALDAGVALRFVVSGEVSYYGAAGAGNNPDGSPYANVPFTYGDGISAPDNLSRVDALLGVFLGAASPTGGDTPASLDFGGGIAFSTLTPGIGQIFFIGNGLTGDTSLGDFGGAAQDFVVPVGATRLYLGTSDGVGWNNNNGSFSVEVSAVPEPAAWALCTAGLAVLGWRARRQRLSNR